MSINIIEKKGQIKKAIDKFGNYSHQDYFSARKLARAYLSSEPSVDAVALISCELRGTLSIWGAGQRGAKGNRCLSTECISKALSDKCLHSKLNKLAKCFKTLRIKKGRRALTPSSPFENLEKFDTCLIETLHILSEKLFASNKNKNVTYPMKALLLLTGLMPAFDSNVRKGLKKAKFTGRGNALSNLIQMPQAGHDDAKKICALPFYIADYVSQFSDVINREVAASCWPELKGEYGRIFDVLLFQQGKDKDSCPIVSFSPPEGIRWYEI